MRMSHAETRMVALSHSAVWSKLERYGSYEIASIAAQAGWLVARRRDGDCRCHRDSFGVVPQRSPRRRHRQSWRVRRGTDVQTTNGPICGITIGAVNEWLGIPYAAPPVGRAALAATTAADAVDDDPPGNRLREHVPISLERGFQRSLPVRERVEAGGLVDQPAGDGSHPRRRVLRRVGNGDNTLAGDDRARGDRVDELSAGDLRVPG